MTVDQLLATVERWAAAQPDVVGLALVGSYARNAARADSDVDLVLLTTDATRYLADPQWPGIFGAVERQTIENWGKVTSIRVWYVDGPEVEFGVTTPEWAALPVDEGTRRVASHGMKVLIDRTGILADLARAMRRL